MGRNSDILTDVDYVADLGNRLLDGAVRADRIGLFRRTLHPQILACATAWAPNRPVEIFDREHGFDLSICFDGSPLYQVMVFGQTRFVSRSQLDSAAWSWADVFRGFALSELMIKLLPSGAALAIGTVLNKGFSDIDLSSINEIARNISKKYHAL